MALTLQIQSRSFWSMSAAETAEVLETDVENGLSPKEVEARLGIFGLNTIEPPTRAQGLLIFLNQFKSPLIVILLLAAGVTFAIGHGRDAIFILAAVAVNTTLGFYQEHKAERALAELKTYLRQRARVIRGGKEFEMDAEDLVPGDLVRLNQGDRAPADCRFIFVNDLQVDEAVLTGESLPVGKHTEPVPTEAVLGDQKSMLFAGTLVTQGVGTGIVCRTDFHTELGKIATLVGAAEKERTPLQAAIRKFSFELGLGLGGLTLLIFAGGIALGYSLLEMFTTSVAVAVSAVPEGLPIAMTVILAVGVERMARRNGVIRKLVAAEALGSATLILTDKTGTLTLAKMELSKMLPVGKEKADLLELALSNTNVLVENPADPPAEWRMDGRVIETSLVRSAAVRGLAAEEIKTRLGVVSSLPFNAVNKFSASLLRGRGKDTLVFLGAPDILLEHSALSAAERAALLAEVSRLAGSGELVLGVATKDMVPKKDFSFAKDLKLVNLSFHGFITLRDPIRAGVPEAIRRVERAGIRIVVLTGDHRGTAEAVAREAGLTVASGGVIDAAELRDLTEEDLRQRLPTLQVIARVSPFDKQRIVKAFQAAGETVAMTGDGVNDAPSIKQADIGIAMGSGTEVARDVADLVLLDDNFETIAAAVEEGRQIMNNIRKVLVYLLSNVADILFLIGGSVAFGLALPLNALQILWVNFFSDSFPAIAFAFERNVDSFSERPWRRAAGLFDPLMKFLILAIGLLTSALLFFLYWFLLHLGFAEELVRTFVFACFGSYTLIVAFSVRSLDKSILSYPAFSNRYLVGGVVIGMALMAAAVYLPFLQTLFGTTPLSFTWVLGVVAVWIVNILAIESGKWFFRRASAVPLRAS